MKIININNREKKKRKKRRKKITDLFSVVCDSRLLKSLYRLKQAAKNWYQALYKALMELGFTRCEAKMLHTWGWGRWGPLLTHGMYELLFLVFSYSYVTSTIKKRAFSRASESFLGSKDACRRPFLASSCCLSWFHRLSRVSFLSSAREENATGLPSVLLSLFGCRLLTEGETMFASSLNLRCIFPSSL